MINIIYFTIAVVITLIELYYEFFVYRKEDDTVWNLSSIMGVIVFFMWFFIVSPIAVCIDIFGRSIGYEIIHLNSIDMLIKLLMDGGDDEE
jgi:uncharacterized oligopeptide transporter (OPT) family protein